MSRVSVVALRSYDFESDLLAHPLGNLGLDDLRAIIREQRRA